MNNLKFIIVLIVILFFISLSVFSISYEWLNGLKITALIFGVMLSIIFSWGLQVVLEDMVETKYDRMFPISDNVIEFPAQ